MQHLRIMGVEEEEPEDLLVLADEAGQEYALPVDEALRTSIGRRSTRPAHLRTRAEDPRAPMTVREVQARLRAGATVERMIADSGLDPERVERYAGPVQAERAYFAQQAQLAEVAPPSSAEQHRIAFGDAPATLEAIVKVRLRSFEVDLDTLVWDAWRRQDGNWQVLCWFDAGPEVSQRAGIETEAPAEWAYSPATGHLRPAGPWAQTLSTLPVMSGSRRGHRLLTPVDGPFDVESSPGEVHGTSGTPSQHLRPARPSPTPADEQDTSPLRPGSPASAAGSHRQGTESDDADHEDLLDVLRARRGQRLGADEEADDKLALMLTRDESTADQDPPHLRAVQSPDSQSSFDDETAPRRRATEDDSHSRGRSRASQGSRGDTDAWGFSYAESEDTTPAARSDQSRDVHDDRGAPQDNPRDQADQAKPLQRTRRSSSRRPNMPRWDDILFGSKDD